MSIIGITGRKRHGKDTIADYLVEHYGYTKMAFADPIRDICRDMFGFTAEQEKDAVDDRWGISPRRAMQFIGTDLVRAHIHELLPDVGDNFWVKCLLNRVPPEARIVVSDVRFPNEAAAVNVLWRVTRPTCTEKDTHASESFVDDLRVNADVCNDGDLTALYRQIDSLMAESLSG